MNALTLPDSVQQFYTVDDGGLLYVRGNPTREDFEIAWAAIIHARDILNRVIGNLMCHAERAEWGGPEYVTGLMERTDRSRNALYQYHSVYSRIPPGNQLPGVKYSYDRAAARLCEHPRLQRAMLERVQRGDFVNSDQFTAAVKQALKEPDPERWATTRDAPIDCPICGGNGWNREHLHWTECPGCGAHGDEILDLYTDALAAIQEFAVNGAVDGLRAIAHRYGWDRS